MKRILFCICLLCFTGSPVSTHAEELPEAMEPTLQALSRYTERIFTPPTYPLGADTIRQIIADGKDWLVHAQEENGHFRYEYDPLTNTYSEDDNTVRQAGALYELGELARREEKLSSDTKGAIERSIPFFENLSKEDSYNGYTFRCVTEPSSTRKCKLGSTSLVLAGLLGYLEANPEGWKKHRALVEDYVSFILAMKKDGSGFRNEYRIGKTTQKDAESGFSNGEAFMALARFYNHEKRTDIATVLTDVFPYLQNEAFETTKYLWMMAGIKELVDVLPNPAFVPYAETFTKWRIDGIRTHRATTKNYCAYIEGVASAYSILEDSVSKDEAKKLRNEIDYWNAKHARFQITPRDARMLIITGGKVMLRDIADMKTAQGGFMTSYGTPTQRIDFTQHCISAYLQTFVDIDGEKL